MTLGDTNSIRRAPRLSFAASAHILRKRIARAPAIPLESVAARSWQIWPSEPSFAPAAVSLPGQLDRVTGWAFADEHPARAMSGGEKINGPTMGYLLKDAWLIDGSVYKGGACLWLNPRSGFRPLSRVELEVEHGALYCTAMGNKYFGQWLMDDCPAYFLAEPEGLAVTLEGVGYAHMRGYEDWLGMRPARLSNAFFRELIVYGDFGQNRSKHLRFRAMGERLLSRVKAEEQSGVFILRGSTGERRFLRNELELAERLRLRRGFRVVDPEKSDVPAIVAACAGARVVAGIEGSGLMHGILPLRAGGAILTLQPPNRFVCVYKDLADRDGQLFGFVVGKPEGEGFFVDPDEVERTLDLFPA